MASFLNWLLDRVWPWSELRRVYAAYQEHFVFSEDCLAYLDKIHRPWRHIRSKASCTS